MIFAIARTESDFNPNAVSDSGAIGLMQIMPQTGRWIATILGVENYSENSLFDVNLNIRFGGFYLSYLFGRFSEPWQVIAAYNAGEGVVADWIKRGIDADSIPYKETKAYVKKVQNAMRYYQGKKFVAFD